MWATNQCISGLYHARRFDFKNHCLICWLEFHLKIRKWIWLRIKISNNFGNDRKHAFCHFVLHIYVKWCSQHGWLKNKNKNKKNQLWEMLKISYTFQDQTISQNSILHRRITHYYVCLISFLRDGKIICIMNCFKTHFLIIHSQYMLEVCTHFICLNIHDSHKNFMGGKGSWIIKV